MRNLQDLFDKQLQDQFSFSNIVADLIESGLAKKDIYLTSQQKVELICELEENKDSFNNNSIVQFSDDGAIQITNTTGSADFELDILEDAQEKMNSIFQNVTEMLNTASDVESERYLANVKKRAAFILREKKKDRKSFDKQLDKRWGKLLDLLEVFILLSEDIGADFTDESINLSNANTSPRFTILSRSHARSCQVAKEILTLLRKGFADGAHARWRTLHEIAVETNIINRNNDEIAKRYVDYDFVQRLQAAKAFHKYDREFDVENVTQAELQDLENVCRELDELYGKDFRNENGWAVSLTGKPRPTFYDLESLADFAHMRPQYKLACLNVHGGPRALFFKFGLRYDGDEDFLLTGPTISGLANPAQNMAYSLLQITAALLTYDVNLDYLVGLKVLFKLEQEIFDVAGEIVENYFD